MLKNISKTSGPDVLIKRLLFCIAVLCFLSLSSCQITEGLVDWVAAQVPVSWQVKIGKTLKDQVLSQYRVLDSEDVQTELKKLVKPLVEGQTSNEYPFQFYIVKSSEVNAFALPGGFVVINSQLILDSDSANEVQGVLAHEIGHIAKQHHLRQLVKTAGLYLIVDAIIGDVSGFLAVLVENSSYLLTQKFSRDYESEADDYAWNLLVNAGITPEGMISFFRKLHEKQADSSWSSLEEKLNFLSTHPTTESRIQQLQSKKLPQNFKENELVLDFQNFKDTIMDVSQN